MPLHSAPVLLPVHSPPPSRILLILVISVRGRRATIIIAISRETCARNEMKTSTFVLLISLNLNFPDSLDSGGYKRVLPLSVTNTGSLTPSATSSRDLILSGYLRRATRLLESQTCCTSGYLHVQYSVEIT